MRKFTSRSLASTLSLVVAIVVELLQAEELPKDNCDPLESPNYSLFGDQTLYGTTRAYLNREQTYLGNSWSYGESTSLEEEHKRLTMEECKPLGLFYVGRHAASYPHHEQIEELNKGVLDLQRRLKDKKRHKCYQKVKPFLEWRPQLRAQLGDLVTPRGLEEQRDIVQRLKRLYPTHFDAHKSEIRLGVTEALKTAQTAGEFLKTIDNWRYEGCSLEELEQNNEVDKVTSNRCYQKLLDQNRLHYQLEYDKLCWQMGSEEPQDDPIMDQIDRPVVAKRMARRISDRLRLKVDENTLASIYEMCAQETATSKSNESVWCSLFTERELKQLEYVRDAVSFTTGAYGPNVRAKQACPLIKDMLTAFEELIKLNKGADTRLRTYFYFSQASHFEKLLADLGLFQDERSYSANKLQAFLSTKAKVPLKRDWRSSLLVPYSANLVLGLYECSNGVKKLLASVNERPVKLDGCKDVVCNWEDFEAAYEGMRQCDLEQICAPRGENKPKHKPRPRPRPRPQKEDEEEEEEERPRRKKKPRRQEKEEKPRKRQPNNGRPPPYIKRKDGTLTVIYS